MTLQEKIGDNYLLGAIKRKNSVRYFLEPIAYWILDYSKYDPEYIITSDDESPFRKGVLKLNDSNSSQFVEAFKEDEVIKEDIEKLKIDFNQEPDRVRLYFLVDFDSKIFVSQFPDIEIEEYIPEDWLGKYDTPEKYL
jgi:hypothetical protein